jgi:molecular chaperone DnaK
MADEAVAKPLADNAASSDNAALAETVAAYLAAEFEAREGIDLRRDQLAWGQLLRAARRALADLERRPITNVNLPCIISDAAGPRHLDVTVTRRILAGLSGPSRTTKL